MKNLPGNFSLPLLAVDALHLRGWVLGPTALSSDYSQSSECSELCWPQARAWAEDAHPPLGHLPRGKLWEASLGGWCWLATSGKIVKLWGKGYPLSVLFSLFSAPVQGSDQPLAEKVEQMLCRAGWVISPASSLKSCCNHCCYYSYYTLF